MRLKLGRLARALLYGPVLPLFVAMVLFAAGVRVGREIGSHPIVVVSPAVRGQEAKAAGAAAAMAAAGLAPASPASGAQQARGSPATAEDAGGHRVPVAGRMSEEPQRLDLNAASAEELERLPGIGPVIARRIVEFRQTHGPFAMVDDLIEVPGIGARTLEKLRALVRVGST